MSYAERPGVTSSSGMPLIYVGGPYRADTERGVELNIRKAEDLAIEVAKLGAVPLPSHPITRFMGGVLPEQFWLDATMAMLERCDAVVLVEGYQESEGTRAEIAHAITKGIPVFVSLYGLECWLKQTFKAPGK